MYDSYRINVTTKSWFKSIKSISMWSKTCMIIFNQRKFFHVLQPILEQVTNADFSDIERVFVIENSKPLKIAHKLNKAVINPKSVEKISVKLAMAVFHETTINALIEYGFLDTANVLRVFMKLWNVLMSKPTQLANSIETSHGILFNRQMIGS